MFFQMEEGNEEAIVIGDDCDVAFPQNKPEIP